MNEPIFDQTEEHEIANALRSLAAAVHASTKQVLTLTKEIKRMSADQAHLDQTVAADEAALTSLEQVITDLKNQPAAAAMDFTAADAFVARIQGDATPPAPAA